MKTILSFSLITVTILVTALSADAQQLTRGEMDRLSETYLKESIIELRDMLAVPNIGNIPEHVNANIEWMDEAFSRRGFSNSLLETDGPPMLLAEKSVAANLPTVLFYMHADGQPVDPTRWTQPDPFDPVLRQRTETGEWEIINWDQLEGEIDPDWRIFARSASDDKGPIGMFLTAIDILNDQQMKLQFNVKVILDFEEELGSPNLPDAIEVHREALSADKMVILDGPRHPTNLPTLSFGARGIQTMTIVVHGPKGSQHSGHYGNYIPNSALRLAQILASMKDEHGRVTIPGFNDGIELDDEAMEILRAVPDDEEGIKRMLGVAGQDSVATFLQASRQYPSLNIRGMASGWVGDDARTIVPSEAIAELDIRLVRETDPDRLINLIQDHIKGMGYHLLDRLPTDEERLAHERLVTVTHDFNYEAFRTDIDSPIGEWLTRAMNRAFEEEPVRIRTSGGSVPISPFVTTLGVPAVSVPTVNNDNNQHSPDENLRIGNYQEGIKTVLSILTEPVH